MKLFYNKHRRRKTQWISRKLNNFHFFHRLFGDRCADPVIIVDGVVIVVVGGCEGIGGGTTDLVDVGGDWRLRGDEITDDGAIDAQIVGWRSVAIEAWGWNKLPNWVAVVGVDSNIGLKRDEVEDGTWWKDDWRLNDNKSVFWWSSFLLFPNHRNRYDGIKNATINIINAIKRTIQNAATIVFVTIRLSNERSSIILK